MEETLKITKKHHKHLNNPFPSTPRSLPFVHGTLSINPQTVPASHQVFPIGNEFQLTWRSKNGGSLSISHQSQPTRPIWSTIPGQAFVSAALAESEVEESRGSFVIRDRDVHLVCNHQIIEEIRAVNQSDCNPDSEFHDFPSGSVGIDEKTESKEAQFPVLIISGRIFSVNKRHKKIRRVGIFHNSEFVGKEPSISAKYWVQGFSRRLARIRRRRLGWWWGNLSKRRAIVTALEFIEHFTEAIGRPPELPEWIISGAVVGMQGGTDFVRDVWEKLQAYNVPVSAFWLQVMHVPFFKYQRSEELLLRWMELNAFTTVFRTHEGNKPACNSQFYSNHKTLSHFARFAKVYKAWKFYRIQLVKEASRKGWPVCRHLFLHYPDDEHVHSLTYEQFLIGEEILVVPVLDRGKNNVKVYFPKGESCSWKHIWTGNLYTKQGSEDWVEAPVGYPAIFVKAESVIGETFLKYLREYDVL